ncbi:MAG: MEDS domain-containing protein [Solirubrobacterales bacterium]
MRAHGSIDSPSGLGLDGHACWSFEGDGAFTDAALEFLTDGLRAGQRIAFVGSEPVADQRERLDALGNVGGLIDDGALQLFTLPDLYAIGEPVDPDAQLAVYAAATDAAVADGYNGLRVAAQVTDLVADPDLWEAHVRWESIADTYMATRPLSALCGYDTKAVPDTVLDDLAAVHPAAHGAAGFAPFHLFSNSDALTLAGEVDGFSADALDRVLGLALRDDTTRLDLGELEFIDHHGLIALAEHTQRRAGWGDLSIQAVPESVRRLCDLLGVRL